MLTLKLDEIPDEGLNLKWTEERASLLAYLKNFSQIDFDFEAPLRIRSKNLEGRSICLNKGKGENQSPIAVCEVFKRILLSSFFDF